MPASTRTKPGTRTGRERGLLITPRVQALLTSVYEHRQLTRDQFTRLHFAQLSQKPNRYPTIVPKRLLHQLTSHEYLIARPLSLAATTGRPPLLYSIGPNTKSS